mmetsp:Transcript_8845/g.11094  ORF Transcript_8845/g.11094 Transcript_8845/m.11094 type:complete len:199 (-) Transcript_8845:270-866(-)
MTRVVLLFCVLCSIHHNVCSALNFTAPDVEVPIGGGEPRIIGGSPAEIDEYPWFTMLRYASGNQDYNAGCGGMLISEEWVLTAAHCINSRFRNNGAVRVGAYKAPYRRGDNGGQAVEFFRLKSTIKHPNYNSRTENNDFALLRIDGISTITPVPLDNKDLSESYTTGTSGLWIFGELFVRLINTHLTTIIHHFSFCKY